MRSIDSINASGRVVKCEAITKHNTNANIYDALYVGGAGDIALVFKEDANDTGTVFTVAAGAFLPFSVRKVLSTGTTATAMSGLIIAQ